MGFTPHSDVAVPAGTQVVNAAGLLPFGAIRGTAANSAVTVGLIGSGGRGTFDAGHLVNVVQPAAFNAAVAEFVGALPEVPPLTSDR